MFKFFVIFMISMAGERLSALPVAAFGDLRGHVEPCGCDPRTDVGGVKRLATAIARYRSSNPNLLVIDAGNNLLDLDSETPESTALARTLEIIKPAASLINQLEWNRLAHGKSVPELTWVLSNYKGPPLRVKTNPLVATDGAEIYGFLGLADKSLRRADAGILAAWKKSSPAKKGVARILMFSGPDKDLAFFYKSKFFDMIVSSNQTKIGIELGDQEQKNERSLVRESKGKIMAWSVPFGGGGLLRLGGLELTLIPSTLENALKPNCATCSGNSTTGLPFPGLPAMQTIHWLRVGEDDGLSDDVKKVFAEAKAKSKDSFLAMISRREKDLGSSEFAGSSACLSCHKSAYEIWAQSKHATAMASLKLKEKQEEPPCVECHVLGFTAKGGYVSEDKSPQFSNVQCESCHGPRRQHAENPTIKGVVDAKTTCAVCHTPPHSPGFDRESYWKKIEHK
jgi:hypothetical protein